MSGEHLKRLKDWREKLAKFELESEEFAWGSCDCTLLAADWIQQATGVDPASSYRGSYSTAKGALRALRRHGHMAVDDAITALLGEPLSAPAFAQRGDIVTLDIEEGGLSLVGVVAMNGREVIALSGDENKVRVPLSRATTAWRLG